MVTRSFQQEDISEAEAPREPLEVDTNDEFERKMAVLARKVAEDVINRIPLPTNHGRIHFNGSTRLVLWVLGVFGLVMTTLLTLVLQAVYTTNGTVSEVRGQQDSTQAQVTEMRREMSAFQSEMMALAQRQNNAQ